MPDLLSDYVDALFCVLYHTPEGRDNKGRAKRELIHRCIYRRNAPIDWLRGHCSWGMNPQEETAEGNDGALTLNP